MTSGFNVISKLNELISTIITTSHKWTAVSSPMIRDMVICSGIPDFL